MIMLKRLIIFLIRRKLGIKTYQAFQFTNQKNKTEYYWFTETNLMKVEKNKTIDSRVSLNWLLSDDCRIEYMSDLDCRS